MSQPRLPRMSIEDVTLLENVSFVFLTELPGYKTFCILNSAEQFQLLIITELDTVKISGLYYPS